MKWFKWIFFLLLLLVAYFLVWPTPVTPVAWTPEPIPALEGPWAATTTIKEADFLFEGNCQYCEDVAVDAAGNIYGGAANGDIKQFRDLNDKEGKILTNTGGRPLGLHFSADDDLWVCDADRGLLRVTPDGGIFNISNQYDGKFFRFTNDLDIGSSGNVYFTVTSDKYGIDNYKFDIIEHRPRGQFFVYEPDDKSTTLLADNLYFANGVAVDPEEQFALICETSNYQIRKIWLNGPKKGESEVLLNNLPGYPDGISRGSNGIYWLTLISPRKSYLEKFFPQPFVIKMVAKLPPVLRPAPGHFLNIVGINADGKTIHNIQQKDPNFAEVSSVQEAYGQLFLGSLGENGIGRIAVPR